MEAVERALYPGTLIHGRYQILKTLGAGGFGITYQALDGKEGLVVAIKEYMPIDAAARYPGEREVFPRNGFVEQYERFRDRFLEEAKLIYRYREHPNIIHVKHLFYENNTAYYVMEYMDGMDLGRLLETKESRLSWQQLAPLMAQAVSSLETVHKSGMIHCDVSPDNLFIMENGQLKLIDFGAAKNVMKGQSSVILLKKGFAPPEQFISDGKLGPWTDIYALAVTVYRAYTGRMPPQATERLVADRTVWPIEMGFSLPSAKWESVLKKAMALRIEDRYQNVRKFWEDLTDVQTEEKRLALVGIQGYFAGKRIVPKVQEDLLLGTDFNRCRMVYPSQSMDISHVHMRLWSDGQRLMAMDMKSRYGTFLNGKRMTAGLVYELEEGMVIELGSRQVFKVMAMERRQTR